MSGRRLSCWIRAILLLTISWLYGQDSTLHFLKNRINFNISARGYWQSLPEDEKKPILLPEYIRTKRIQTNNYFNESWNYSTDNPLYHAAFNLGAHTKVEVGKGFTIYGSLLTEHRGFSYGVNSTNNIIVFPQLKLYMDRKFKLGRRDLWLNGYVGNHINARVYEGLTLYNMYQQGYNYKIRYGKFQFQYFQTNDLLIGTGMFIDETYDAIFSLEELNLGEKWKMDLKSGTSVYYMEDVSNRLLFNISAGIYVPQKSRLYGQLSYRPISNLFEESEKFAAVLGYTYSKKTKRIRWENRAEARYYGAFFNAGFVNYNVYYRRAGVLYGNTVGAHFYPIMLYDRPFSQWAVYAEYQDQNYYNVAGVSYTTDLKIKLHEELTLLQQYDINYIQSDNGSKFIYPFATLGIAWEPIENNYLSIGLTNKGMNLDLHYQTHYLYKYPSVQFSMVRDLHSSWFGWE